MPDEQPSHEILLAYLSGDLDEAATTALARRIERDPLLQAALDTARAELAVAAAADDQEVADRFAALLGEAVEQGAAGLHLDLDSDGGVVRLRVDGQLGRTQRLASDDAGALFAHIRNRLGLPLLAPAQPAEGRAELRFGRRRLVLHGSWLPGLHGGRLHLRLLDPDAALLPWEQLGLLEAERDALQRFLRRRRGLLLVTGPTGGGRTTLLYHLLQRVAGEGVSALSVEQPIELDLPWVAQTAADPARGLTLARALRAMSRHDPDVVLVGDLPDAETAHEALALALGGVLVVAGTTADDGVEALLRMAQAGVDRHLLADGLLGVVATRLARRTCPECRVDEEGRYPAAAGRLQLDRTTFRYVSGAGCEACRGTGFRGRIGLFEVVVATAALGDALVSGAPEEILRELAFASGLPDFRRHAAGIVEAGLTTPEEAVRVLPAGF